MMHWLPLQSWTFLVAQTVKHLPTMQETRVSFLGGEDSLEKEMATRSSILAWEMDRETWQPIVPAVAKESDMT